MLFVNNEFIRVPRDHEHPNDWQQRRHKLPAFRISFRTLKQINKSFELNPIN